MAEEKSIELEKLIGRIEKDIVPIGEGVYVNISYRQIRSSQQGTHFTYDCYCEAPQGKTIMKGAECDREGRSDLAYSTANILINHLDKRSLASKIVLDTGEFAQLRVYHELTKFYEENREAVTRSIGNDVINASTPEKEPVDDYDLLLFMNKEISKEEVKPWEQESHKRGKNLFWRNPDAVLEFLNLQA